MPASKHRCSGCCAKQHRLFFSLCQDGQTPLHMAASGRLDGDLDGRLACITHLLAAKANLELPDKVSCCTDLICLAATEFCFWLEACLACVKHVSAPKTILKLIVKARTHHNSPQHCMKCASFPNMKFTVKLKLSPMKHRRI